MYWRVRMIFTMMKVFAIKDALSSFLPNEFRELIINPWPHFLLLHNDFRLSRTKKSNRSINSFWYYCTMTSDSFLLRERMIKSFRSSFSSRHTIYNLSLRFTAVLILKDYVLIILQLQFDKSLFPLDARGLVQARETEWLTRGEF